MDKPTRPKIIDEARLRQRAIALAVREVNRVALGESPSPTRAFDNILSYECEEEHRDIVHDVYDIRVDSHFIRMHVVARHEDGPQICDFTLQIYRDECAEIQPRTLFSGRIFM